MLTIAYITNRKEPHIEWFWWSLNRELNGFYGGIQVIVVDFHANAENRRNALWAHARVPFLHIPPKPTPWQGSERLIDHDAFAAGNARNTAICAAAGTHIVFVDDVSVLVNGWITGVRQAQAENRVTCGAYRKVLKLTVDAHGNLTHWIPQPGKLGVDNRWNDTRAGANVCPANWLYGCSFVAPVETLLSVNGFDECLDGLSFEDVCLGLRLAKAGHQLWYDQRILTFESEEAHHNPEDVDFRRHNRPIEGHKDLAWWQLDYVKNNHMALGTPDLRAIRDQVLKNKPFPTHTGFFKWPDGKDLLGR